MTRVAALDCGTNSIRLLIADVVDGRLVDVVRRTDIVRLGSGVDKTGRFDPAAIDRTLAMTRVYADACAANGVDAIRFVATSATRDAQNRGQFLDGVHEILGVVPEVVPGTEEAALSFRGVVSALGSQHPAPYLVVDLGGGSTELVLGADSPEAAYSMNIGCVRMTERHGLADSPSPEQVVAARSDVREALGRAFEQVPVAQTATIVGVAGTVTTITAHALSLPKYDRDRIDGAELSVAEALAASDALLTLPRAERAALPYMHPGRVDVMPAGALIWQEVLNGVVSSADRERPGHSEIRVVTSEHDILDGVALSLVEAA